MGSPYRDAIASIESAGSGGYSALGPVTNTGDRAYGRYQVMGSNIPSWTRAVLGREMAPTEFLNSQAAQDAVFDAKFNEFSDQYGGPDQAASVWFTGKPIEQGAGLSDQLGTTGSEYVDRFRNAIGVPSPAGGPQSIIPNGLLAGGGGMAEPQGLLSRVGTEGFLSSAFLSNLGAGILAANRSGAPLGSAIGQGLLSANQAVTQRDQDSIRNDALRQQLGDRQRKATATARVQELIAGGAAPNSPEVMGLLADISPDSFAQGLLAQAFPSPTGFEREASAVEARIGRPLTNDEVFRLAGGGGTTVNIGEKLNEPIPVPQLDDIRMPDGSTPPIGTTFSQARDAGAVVLSSDERKAIESAESATAVIDQLETLALGGDGEDGIFSNVEPGFMNRAEAAVDHFFEMLSQDDPRVSQFSDLAQGTISQLGRTFGSTGALSDTDLARMEGLIPRTFPLPDTAEVARSKFQDLRALVSRGLGNLERIQQGRAPDLGDDTADQQQEEPTEGDTKPVSGFMERAGAALGYGQPITEADIQQMMRENNMTRAEVRAELQQMMGQ